MKMLLQSLTLLLLGAGSQVFAGYDKTSNTNVAVYWGTNSAGVESLQSRLGTYCDDQNVDIFILSFLTDPIQLVMNFANQGGKCDIGKGGAADLVYCHEIEEDIKTCQGKGKTVLLSIGGESSTFKGFASKDDATKNAKSLWDSFGPVSDPSAKRPFGTASVDGFDLDLETGTTLVAEWATELRKVMGDKNYLSAAPDCLPPTTVNTDKYWPANSLTNVLDAAKFDMLFVQFYNTDCGPENTHYTLDAWNTYAKEKNTKLFMGLPAQPKAAYHGGFIDAKKLPDVVKGAKGKESFAGIMLWDASQSFIKDAQGTMYHEHARKALQGSA